MRQVVISIEKTGPDPYFSDRIVEIGGIELLDGKLSGKVFHQYVNPQKVIGGGVTEQSFISNEFLEDKSIFEEADFSHKCATLRLKLKKPHQLTGLSCELMADKSVANFMESWPMTPLTAAPPTVPTALPPVKTAPVTAPMPAPAAVLLS